MIKYMNMNMNVNINLYGVFEHPANIKMAERCIHQWFRTIKNNKEDWKSDQLMMEEGKWMEQEGFVYQWQQNKDIFQIHSFVEKDTLFFKLLPVGMKYDRSFGYDGVVRGDDDLDDETQTYLNKNGEVIQESFTDGFVMWINVWRD